MVIVVRFVTDNLSIIQRVASLTTAAHSVNGSELAGLIIESVTRKLDIPRGEGLVAAMHDRASVNKTAITTVQVLWQDLLDVPCFSHFMSGCGEKFDIDELDSFITLWVCTFSHSPAARLLFKEIAGVAPRLCCVTRWWSRWEVMHQVHSLWSKVVLFINADSDVSPKTRKKMRDVM